MKKETSLTALERFSLYLSSENWIQAVDGSYYCEQYPEFRLKELKLARDCSIDQKKIPENDRWMPESWNIGKGKITVTNYRGYYFDGCIVEKDITIWWCDNGREPVPLPESKSSGQNLVELENAEYTWELSKQSLQYKVAKVIAEFDGKNLEEILNKTKIIIVD